MIACLTGLLCCCFGLGLPAGQSRTSMHANIEGWPDTVLAMPSSACTLSGTSSSCRHSVSSCRHSIELSCPEHTFWSLNARHRSQLPCHTNPCPERSQHPNCNQALSVKGLASPTPAAPQQVAALHSPEALQTARAASITLTGSPLSTSDSLMVTNVHLGSLCPPLQMHIVGPSLCK